MEDIQMNERKSTLNEDRFWSMRASAIKDVQWSEQPNIIMMVPAIVDSAPRVRVWPNLTTCSYQKSLS